MTFFANVGSPGTVSTASGGKVYGYNNISESAARTVAPANPQRTQITFHNPGSNDLYIAPANVQNTLGTAPNNPNALTDTALTPSNAALGGALLVYSQGTLVITGECQGAWQALAKTSAGTTNPLTVIDTNV